MRNLAGPVIHAGAASVVTTMTLKDRTTTADRIGVAQGLHSPADPGQTCVTMETVSLPDNQPSDMTILLVAVRDRRDREAFARIFNHFGPRLKAMLMRGGLRDGTAEDVVQDVMLAIWHKAAQFDPHRAEASGWIYRIARNRQIDLARRRPPPQPDDLEEPADTGPDALQMLALQQEAGLLRAALARLAPEQQAALTQAYMEDLPQSEIGHRTGLPLGTVKSRIRLGLERLRHELKDLTR